MNTRPRQAERPTSHESLLLDYVQRLARRRAGRRALHVHLSRLRPENRRDQHLRIAKNAFQTLFRSYEGELFTLRNADMVFITRLASPEEMTALIDKFRPLFGDDPAAQSTDPAQPFCTYYDLENEYEAFLKLAETFEAQRFAAQVGPAIYEPPLEPLRPEELAH